MNEAPPNSPGAQRGHPGTDSFFDSLRRIDVRRSEDGWIGGVSAGIAHRLGFDPIVIRAGFVLLGLVFGIGLLIYLAAWLLIPDSQDRTHLERAMREGDGTSIVLLVFAVIVGLSSLPWWGGSSGWFGGWGGWWFVGLLLVALLFWGLWTVWERRDDPGSAGRVGSSGYPSASSHASSGYPGSATGTAPPAPPGTAMVSDSTSGTGRGQQAATTGQQQYYSQGAGYPGPAGPGGPGVPAGPGGPAPVKPAPKPRRRSGGAIAGLIAAGLALATYGSLEWAARTYDWPGNSFVVATAGTLAVLGLVVLVLGLAGRRGGFAGFLAAMALFVTAVTAPLPDNLNFSGGVGDRDWRPTSVSEFEDFRLGAGEATLDLRGLDPGDLDGQSLKASVGAGQLNIRLPENLTVQLEASVSMGQVTIRELDFGRADRATGGTNITENHLLGTGEADLVLDASVGLGEIVVERN